MGRAGERVGEIVEKLAESRDRTAAYFGGLSPEVLDREVYADGAMWRVRQVMAHLLTLERTMHHLFRDMLAGGPGDTGEFDLERYNRSQPQKYDEMAFDEVIAGFVEVREETIAIAAGMSEDDLDREGRHAFHGDGTLERFVRWAYEHSDVHMEDVQRALSESAK